jgi:hypothetical protein
MNNPVLFLCTCTTKPQYTLKIRNAFVKSGYLYLGTPFAIMGRVAQSVQRLTTGWTVRGSNPGEARFPWSPPSFLYNGYRVFPGGKVRPGRAADHSPPSSAAVMEDYSYTSTHSLDQNRACNGNTSPYTICNPVRLFPLCHFSFPTSFVSPLLSLLASTEHPLHPPPPYFRTSRTQPLKDNHTVYRQIIFP